MKKTALSIALLMASAAHADFLNGPNPYSAEYGFDTPTEAGWSWSRGDSDTLYAEWDTFTKGSYNHSPDIASAGNTILVRNTPTIVTGTSNLYAFTGDQAFSITIDNSGLNNGDRTIALQIETWGTTVKNNFSLAADGQSINASSVTNTHSDRINSSFGEVDLDHWLVIWNDIDVASFNSLAINGFAENHASLTQFALDIGNTSEVPVPAAAWLFGSALVGLSSIKRKK